MLFWSQVIRRVIKVYYLIQSGQLMDHEPYYIPRDKSLVWLDIKQQRHHITTINTSKRKRRKWVFVSLINLYLFAIRKTTFWVGGAYYIKRMTASHYRYQLICNNKHDYSQQNKQRNTRIIYKCFKRRHQWLPSDQPVGSFWRPPCNILPLQDCNMAKVRCCYL